MVLVSDLADEGELDFEAISVKGKDGSLATHIPLMELQSQDANAILKTKEAVYTKIMLSYSNPSNTVEVDLWYSSSLDLGLKLADELAALSYSFGGDHQK